MSEDSNGQSGEVHPKPCMGFLQRENFSTEIIESISPEDLQPMVKICIDGLQSLSIAVKRSAAAKFRLLGKNRADNRALIVDEILLIPLLLCSDLCFLYPFFWEFFMGMFVCFVFSYIVSV